MRREENYKVLVVGQSNAGKTSFINRCAYGKFQKVYKPTIGVDFALRKYQNEKNVLINAQLWDVAGTPLTAAFNSAYCKNANVVLIFVDLSLGVSALETAGKWKEKVDENMDKLNRNEKHVPCVLIGNKSDLASADNMVTLRQEIQSLCETVGFDAYFEISCLLGTNVEEALVQSLNLGACDDDSENDEDNSFVVLEKPTDPSHTVTYPTKRRLVSSVFRLCC